MIKIQDKLIRDKKGHPHSVVVNIKKYRKLLKQAEEFESIRSYDAAKASEDEAIPFPQAKKEIDRTRS